MERIIESYDELPSSRGQSIYIRMETDPRLYLSLLQKGYRIVNRISEADGKTIYVTGRRQDRTATSTKEYKKQVDSLIQTSLKSRHITKPKTAPFSYQDLVDYKYQIPFVFKNENQNGGREKFLIATEEDYENLIATCNLLIQNNLFFSPYAADDDRNNINYRKYLEDNFTIQEYVHTPSEYNTTIRLITSASNDLLCALLKYKKPDPITDDTTLIGYLLRYIYPLSTKSIMSNTLSGGSNICIGEEPLECFERELLREHQIPSSQFEDVVQASKDIHEVFQSELGIICGFDYIYDADKEKWHLLEYHSRPMVGQYAIRQGLPYDTYEERLTAEGKVRATALSLALKKTR